MEERHEALGVDAAAPDLWEDAERAKKVMRELDAVGSEVAFWSGLERRVADALELAELLEVDGDEALGTELETEADALTTELGRAETSLLFAGPYDSGDAVLSIHAGAGGTESQDWAEMLQRMYVRWAERMGFSVEVIDTTPGEEAGIKSTTLEIQGRRAYGWLKSERGVHRLVRISPYDASSRRHTSLPSWRPRHS
jgi:peptide chain release factor 2